MASKRRPTVNSLTFTSGNFTFKQIWRSEPKIKSLLHQLETHSTVLPMRSHISRPPLTITTKKLLIAVLTMSTLADCSKALSPGLIQHPEASGKRFQRKLVWRTRRIHCFRTGANYSSIRSTSVDLTENDGDSTEERFRQRGMMIALASTYLTVMGAKCALPSVLSLLTSRSNGLTFPTINSVTPQSRMATLLGMSTLAVALGKLLLGPVIDTLGGIRALKIALSLLMALLATISLTQQFKLFAVCWILVDFIFSSCWASCINAIHQSFPQRDWGKQVGILAMGARTGNALSFAMFASILQRLEQTVNQPWRQVFAVSALLQLIPLSLLTYFGGKTLRASQKNQNEQPETKAAFQTSLNILRREAATVEFWLHLVSRSVLMIFASFLLFVPTLMSQVYGVSNAGAAQCASIYSMGCLLSVTLGSSWYSTLPKTKQALASMGLTGMATISSLLQLAHVSGLWTMKTTFAATTLFFWGFAFSIPFYIPPSLYALSRGGKQSSATIADVFDIGGFALLALFNGYVASIDHATPTAWIPTFMMTTACSLISLLSLPFAIMRQ